MYHFFYVKSVAPITQNIMHIKHFLQQGAHPYNNKATRTGGFYYYIISDYCFTGSLNCPSVIRTDCSTSFSPSKLKLPRI